MPIAFRRARTDFLEFVRGRHDDVAESRTLLRLTSSRFASIFRAKTARRPPALVGSTCISSTSCDDDIQLSPAARKDLHRK